MAAVKKIKRNRITEPPIYCDSASFEVGLYGLKIAFGTRRTDDKNEGQEIIDDHVMIGMSAEHALALYDALRLNLNAYHKHCGDIRVPRSDPADEIEKVENKILVPQ